MERAAAALVAGVERREQLDHLAAADLADHQPVGTHPQRLPDQGAQIDRPGALDVGRPPLQPHHVRVVGAQLGGVLDDHDALAGGTSASSAESRVVLPLPVPPLIRKASRASTTRSSSRTTSGGPSPAAASSARVKPRRCGTRSEITVPGRATGARTAWKRVPSGSRRSAYGVASSRRRPAAEARR